LDADDLLCLGAINLLKPHLRANVSKIQFMLLPIDKFGNVIGHAFPRLKPSDDSGVLIESIIKSGFYLTPPLLEMYTDVTSTKSWAISVMRGRLTESHIYLLHSSEK